MINFEVKISIKELSEYSGIAGDVEDEKTLVRVIESFSKYIVELYGRLVEESINSRRYRGHWEPVDEEGYIEYIGVEPKEDIIYSIRNAIESQKVGYNFIIRIDPDYRYPGTDIPLIKVLRAIENGTSEFSARPILYKVASQIRSHIKELWRGYLAMKGVIV